MKKSAIFDRTFRACGRTWHMCGADMEKLWDEMKETDGEDRIPYWNEIWPSSLAMAGWLMESESDIRDLQCLDLGCGLGFTALVGRWLGADVVGADYESEALAYAKKNEKMNGIEGIRWELLDWRDAEGHRERFDRIWASDVMYESETAKPLAIFLSTALKKGGRAWIAEPGRSIFLEFIRLLPQHGLHERRLCSLPVFPLTAQKVPVTVTLWELSLSV